MINIKGNTYYIPGPVNIGVYVKGNECMLIDTGLDDSAAKRILKELKERELTPTVIVNTHAHADHFGGNRYIRKKEDVVVCTGSRESAVVRYPEYEPFYLFSASPLQEMKNKFFMAQPSMVNHILMPGEQEVKGFTMNIVPLPGHSIDQIGVVTDDGVLFCADAVLGEDIIHKYDLPYIYDVGQQMDTLNYLAETNFDCYVLAHGGVVQDIKPTVVKNRSVMDEIKNALMQILDKPLMREEILSKYVQIKNIELNMVQYPLLFASISAYLSYMANAKKVKYWFEDGKLLWERSEK